MAVHIVMADPNRVFTGRAVPVAWDPDITAVVIAVIACDPRISAIGSRSPALINRGRRPDVDINLRKSRGRKQRESEK